MFGRKKPNRIAAILIAAILVTQFNVTSFGAEAGNYAGSGESVSGPVVHFTVPPRSAEPEPEAPVYPTATPIPNFTPVFPNFPTNLPAQAPVVIATPVPTTNPAVQPTLAPTQNPSANPSVVPTANPTTIPAEKQGVNTTPTPAPGVTLSSNNTSPEYINKEEELKNMGMPEDVRNYVLSKYVDKTNPESVRENLLNMMEGSTGIQSIEFKDEEITIIEGEKTRLEPVIKPDSAVESLIWESDDESIVTVNEEGLAEGISHGNATITVRAKGGAYAKCTVKCLRSDSIYARIKSIIENESESVSGNNGVLDTVSGDSITFDTVSDDEITPDGASLPTSIKFKGGDEDTTVVIGGKNVKVEVEIEPPEARGDKLTWTILDKSKATVNEDGYITGLVKGETTLIVTTSNGLSDQCKISIVPATPTGIEGMTVEGMTVNNITIVEGDTVDVKPDILPRKGVEDDDKVANWSISPSSVAGIQTTQGKTNKVTGLDGGTNGKDATLTVSLVNYPKVTATCTVKVLPRITSITLTSDKDEIFIGETANLSISSAPRNVMDKELNWTYTPSSVADVYTASKQVKGKAEGTITITASLKKDSTVKGSCTIRVKPVPVDSLTLTPDTLEITKGQTGDITVTVNPTSPYKATNQTVDWESSDDATVRIETPSTKTTTYSGASVRIYGVKASDDYITITAKSRENPAKIATCRVKVIPPIDVKGLEVDPKKLELEIGDSTIKSITARIDPENATTQTVTWDIIQDGDQVKVYGSKTGKTLRVYGGSISGNAIARATLVDNGKTYTDDCEITVVPRKVKGITLTPEKIEMDEADPSSMTGTLTAKISPTNAANQGVTWSVDDPGSIITLSGDGLMRTVTGLKPGTATVTVITDEGGFTDTSTITIKKKIVSINGIDLIVDPDPMVIKRGGSGQLSWKFTPDDADEDIKASTPVVLSSANPEIAALNPETAIGEGSATVSGCSVGETDITVATADGKYSGTCHVKVEWTDVTGVSLSCNEIDLYEGETQKLIATVEPEKADIKTVSWNSASPATASVDQEGIVTGVKEGTTVVTVVTVDGGKKDFCIVHVHKRGKEAEGIIVNPSENRIDLSVNPEFDLTAILFPEGATDKKITWKSNNTAVVTVSGDNINGLTAKAVGKAKGTAVITATTSNGKTAVCLVTVDEPSKVYVEDVYLDQMRKTIYVGESFDLTANVMPDNAYDKTVTWSSGDGKIATVSEGRVTGLKKGEVTITVTANGDTLDGEPAIAICYVTVKDEPQPAPDVYKLFIVDERSGAYRPDKVRGTVESLAGDRYLVIRDSSGSEIKPLINGDSSLSYTRALYYDMWIVDINGWPKEDFVKCTVRIPLPKDMDINKGTVRVVTMLNGRLDKSISSSVGEEDGVQYVSFTTTHFTQYAILYKEVSKQTSTTVVYRDVPVIQYRETTSQPVYYTQPAPAQTIPFVNTRVLDNVPRTGEGINLRERLCEIFTSKPKQEK